MKNAMMWCGLAVVVPGLIAGVAGQARAGLIVQDDAQYGAGSIIQDTATGLEWLSVTNTAGLTYDYVASQLGLKQA